MSKHTPGPWEFKNDMLDEPDALYRIKARGQDHGLAIVGTQANAALISTSPELLEIAKAYRNLLRTMAHTEGEVRTFNHIESVIAKAEGK